MSPAFLYFTANAICDLQIDVEVVAGMEIDQLTDYLPLHGQRLFALHTAKLIFERGNESTKVESKQKRGKLIDQLQIEVVGQ